MGEPLSTMGIFKEKIVFPFRTLQGNSIYYFSLKGELIAL